MYSVYLSNKHMDGTYDEVMIFNDKLNDKEFALISPVLELESGLSGGFDFTIPPCNVGYNLVHQMTTEVIVKKNNKEKWRGRVLNPESDFYNQVKVECEGELSYLNDTFQPQHEYKTESLRQVIEGILSIHNNKVGTKNGDTWIPNASEPIDKIFYVGACFVSPDDDSDPTGTDKSYRNTDYETTLACLKKIADNYKGYFVIRKQNGKRYLDFIKDFTEICQQRIDFGENLLDFTKSFKMEDLCTVAMPIGGRVNSEVGDEVYIYHSEDGNPVDYLNENGDFGHDDAGDREAGVVYIDELGLTTNDKLYVSCTQYGDQDQIKDGIWAFATASGTVIAGTNKSYSSQSGIETYEKYALTIPAGAQRLRVASTTFEQPRLKVYKQKAESGLDEHFTIAGYSAVDNENFKHNPDDIYVIYKPLYEKYGWHEKKLEFNNLEKSEELWSMTTYWLTHTQFEQMVLDITALDLSYMNVNYDDIWINMKVPIYSLPHGLTDNLLLPCTKIRVSLGDIENTEYTLGYTTPSEISDTQGNVNADLSKLMDQVPTYSDTFKAIQENSTQIIDSMYSDGTVVFRHDRENHPEQISAIIIANAVDDASADKRWVWNLGGLGFQEKQNGQWQNFGLALTMDGTIMGNRIAAHTFTADNIWGGKLDLGYLSYSETDPSTGETIVHHTDGELRVFNSDGYRVAAIEDDWGITSENPDDIYDDGYNYGIQVRVRNGYIYGGFKNNTPTGSRDNPRNEISVLGEACTGSIQFNNPYTFDGRTTYGVDVVTKTFGIRSDRICFTNTYDPDAQGHEVYVGQNGIFTVDGYRLHFVHGLLAKYEQIDNGGE